MRSALVPLAHPSDATVNSLQRAPNDVGLLIKSKRNLVITYLAAVDELDSCFAEEEVHKVAERERADEVGSCKKRERPLARLDYSLRVLTIEAQAVVLIRLEWLSVDDWIVAAEVGFGSAVQVVICGG
jgi:hypothetical protein